LFGYFKKGCIFVGHIRRKDDKELINSLLMRIDLKALDSLPLFGAFCFYKLYKPKKDGRILEQVNAPFGAEILFFFRDFFFLSLFFLKCSTRFFFSVSFFWKPLLI